jgi:hypothetical protein
MNISRLILALLAGTLASLVLWPLQRFAEIWFGAFSGVPIAMIVLQGRGGWLINMILATLLLEVLLPVLFYAWFAENVFRKSDWKMGMCFGFTVFMLGSLAQHVFLPMLLRVPAGYSLAHGLTHLIDLMAVGFIAGLIYKPRGSS